MVYDLILAGGTVVDGTGNPGFRADVGIQGDRVHLLPAGSPPPETTSVLDVSALVVAPGFIDMHSHSGLMILADPRHMPKVSQGVTTEVIGVDGCSYAPFERPEDLRDFVTMNAGLDGRPDIRYDWDTVASQLSRYDNQVAVNIACLVGNSALRINELGWEDVQASTSQLRNMSSRLREAMEEGAFGLSTGLDYPPGSYASTDELGQLSREVSKAGGIYHTHVRYWLGDRFLDPFREAFRIAEIGAAALHITHFYYRASFGTGSRPMFQLLDDALRRGVDVTFDAYPYEWSSTRLSIFLPQWIQRGGPNATMRRLTDPSERRRFKDELAANDPVDSWRGFLRYVRLGNFERASNLVYENLTVQEVADRRGQDVVDTVFDLLVEEDLGITEVHPGPTGSTIASFLRHPVGMVGTDSVFIGDKPSPRTYGSFPRILGEFVREEACLSLPEAVRKFTSFPARRLGLRDRGLLVDGFRADVTVFDPERIRALATYDEPRQQSTGVEYVFVNGTMVLDRGVHTGALPGRSLRRGRH